jgi:predicted RNA-binding Zn ribbon-like protein
MVMSKQQQAPGELELVRAFVNSTDLGQGSEQLRSAEALAIWLAEHGLMDAGVSATDHDLVAAVELREALRAILLVHTEGSPPPSDAVKRLDGAARRARLDLRFCGGGATVLEPEADGVDGALGRLLAIVHDAIARGTWDRLKACRLHTCEWAFYDHTKNHSGAWCNMDVCGNRAKARAYRERRAPSQS